MVNWILGMIKDVLFNHFSFPYLKNKLVRRLHLFLQSCNSPLNSCYSFSQCNFEHMLRCLLHCCLLEVLEHPQSGSLCCTPWGTLRRISSTKDYNFSALRFLDSECTLDSFRFRFTGASSNLIPLVKRSSEQFLFSWSLIWKALIQPSLATIENSHSKIYKNLFSAIKSTWSVSQWSS